MFFSKDNYDFVRTISEEEYKDFLRTNPFLTKNFRLNEFLKSQTASRNGIENIPSPEEFLNLQKLCKNIMQPIRSYYKRPVSVSSGFRCKELNEMIGGSDRSQHMKGMACDFEILGLSNYAVALHLSRSNLNFDQLICEFHYASNPQSGWVHISYDPTKEEQRKSILTINKYGVKKGIRLDV